MAEGGVPGPVDWGPIDWGPIDWGPIDWAGLASGTGLVSALRLADLRNLAGQTPYLASPVTRFLEADEPELALAAAAEWQAWLLAEGVSAISPVLLTLPPLHARGDDQVGLELQRLRHRDWMRLCRPWMELCPACLVAPVRGWSCSRGVWEEASWFARRAGRPVYLLEEWRS